MNPSEFNNRLAPHAIRPLHILYAEGLRPLRLFMSSLLARDGHRVEAVQDGAEALECLVHAPHAYDLLLADHHLPRLDGLELVRRLREEAYPGRIIVFCAGLREMEQHQYRLLGVDLLLPRVLFPDTLRRIFVRMFRRPPRYRPLRALRAQPRFRRAGPVAAVPG